MLDPTYRHIPLSLNPCPYPVHLYNQSMRMQESMGVLYANLCKEHEQMTSVIRQTSDPFIERLLQVAD